MRSLLRGRARGATPALALTAALALATSACGGSTHDAGAGHAGNAAGTGRTVDVVMVDSAYQPTTVTVKKGETVTFRFRNDGLAVHEAYLGDDAAQMAHATEMQQMGSMPAPAGHGGSADDHGMADGGHGPMAVTVQPGGTGELTSTFNDTTTLWLGCHQPGHWEAGMKLEVRVG